MLHRLLRGTGLQGLRGIAPARPIGAGVTVVRPLLKVPRSEVLAYLAALGQDYRQDSSNADVRYGNRIRHELLPCLAKHYNPAVASVLARLAVQAQEAFPEIERLAEELRQASELPLRGINPGFRPPGSWPRYRRTGWRPDVPSRLAREGLPMADSVPTTGTG